MFRQRSECSLSVAIKSRVYFGLIGLMVLCEVVGGLIVASGTGASKRAAARSPNFRRIDIRQRGHPATVPMGRLYTRTGVFGIGLSHAGSSSLVQAKVVPSRQMRLMMTASFRAVATMAFFIPLRATSRMAHALSGEKRDTRWIRMLAAS